MSKKILVDKKFLKDPRVEKLKNKGITLVTEGNEDVICSLTSDLKKAKKLKGKGKKVIYLIGEEGGSDLEFNFNVKILEDGVAAIKYFLGKKSPKVLKGVCTVIFNEKNKVLILRKRGNNSWELVKGRLENKESEKECAEREIREEVGLKELRFIVKLPIKTDFLMVHKGEIYRKVYSVFLFKTKDEKVELAESFSGFKFVSPKEAGSMISWEDQKNAVKFVRNHMELVS